jgi:hypothetical protein
MTETPSKPDVPIIPPAEESVEKRKDHIREYVKEKLANGVRDAAPYVKLLYGDLWLYNELKKQSYDVERYNGMNTIWFDRSDQRLIAIPQGYDDCFIPGLLCLGLSIFVAIMWFNGTPFITQ